MNFYNETSLACSKLITNAYSTSFSMGIKAFDKALHEPIYAIYGFVRYADEIVDTFHEYDKSVLFNRFEKDLEFALEEKISLNPILNSFQETVHKYNIERGLIASFMKSMRLDLSKKDYLTEQEYKEYIYGSADVVGLMCLHVFLKGDTEKYSQLKDSAMALGSAFQKVNFLRDLKADFEGLSRTYFPNTNLEALDEASKQQIIEDIEGDFQRGYQGILKLPADAKFGVFMAYRYYRRLLKKLHKTPALEIKNTRIRVPGYEKFGLLTRSYVKYQLKLVR